MVQATFNEQILTAMVRHQIGLLRYSDGVTKEIWTLLDASESDIRHQIEDGLADDIGREQSPALLKRVQRVIDGVIKTRLASWGDATPEWMDKMHEITQAEPGFTAGLIESIVPAQLDMVLPASGLLKSLVETKPFMGATMKEWADTIQAQDLARIEQAIKIGMTQGESAHEISRRVVGDAATNGKGGTTQITRNQAGGISRTAISAFTSAADDQLYKDNADIIDKILFVATLDSHTTPICRSLDGKKFDVGDAPVLPLHWGERSKKVPVIDGLVIGERPIKKTTEKQILRDFAAKHGLESVPKSRNEIPHGLKTEYDEFKRQAIGDATGTTPAKTSYDEFLKSLPAHQQDDILGVAKGKLYREGGLTLDKFVAADGSELTLEQLAASYAKEFEAAGLDPKKYIKAGGGEGAAAPGAGESSSAAIAARESADANALRAEVESAKMAAAKAEAAAAKAEAASVKAQEKAAKEAEARVLAEKRAAELETANARAAAEQEARLAKIEADAAAARIKAERDAQVRIAKLEADNARMVAQQIKTDAINEELVAKLAENESQVVEMRAALEESANLQAEIVAQQKAEKNVAAGVSAKPIAFEVAPSATAAANAPLFKSPSSMASAELQEYKRRFAIWEDSLSKAEQKALQQWHGSGYSSVRYVETGNTLGLKALEIDGQLEKAIARRDAMYSAVSDAPHVAGVELHRGIHMIPEIEKLVPGSVYETTAISSWSESATVAQDFGEVILNVKSKRSFELSRMKWKLDDDGEPGGELEHLILKGTRYRVVDIETKLSGGRNRMFISLEEL